MLWGKVGVIVIKWALLEYGGSYEVKVGVRGVKWMLCGKLGVIGEKRMSRAKWMLWG